MFGPDSQYFIASVINVEIITHKMLKHSQILRNPRMIAGIKPVTIYVVPITNVKKNPRMKYLASIKNTSRNITESSIS